jgi:hypothetical protein
MTHAASPRLFAASLLVGFASGCSTPDACNNCAGQEVCIGVPLPDGGIAAQCGKQSGALEPCGPSIPAACANADLACISFDGLTGVCYQLCDPLNPVCTGDLSCLAVLNTPDAGICAQPNPTDGGCDEGQQLFCPAGQVCLGPGTCFKRCDPTLTNNCPQLESCVTPSPFDTGLSICVQPQPVGGSCSPANSVYCGVGAFCVQLGDGGDRCLKDCTDGGVCPSTQACRSVTDQNMTLVVGVCY